MYMSLTFSHMVHSPICLSSNCLFFQAAKLKAFKQRLTARKLIKDLECHAKINLKNLGAKFLLDQIFSEQIASSQLHFAYL